MNIEILSDNMQVCLRALELLNGVVEAKPNAVVGLATGSTPLGLYKLMCDYTYKNKYKQITTVNLDEYVGIDANNANSYHYYMRRNLFDGIGLHDDNAYLPQGDATDLQQECSRYNELLDGHPRDIQILGLGSNGHIAFNEPNTPFDSLTHIVNLSQSTIQDNARLFDSLDVVPTQAITMGLADILESKLIVVLASGLNKAHAVRDMVEGGVDSICPASILQTHSNCIVLCDRDAASMLHCGYSSAKAL